MPAPLPRRVTQRVLAQLAAVSHTTVSLALRGHASIPEATRVRIRSLAKKHGYRPDPMLAALNAYRVETTPAHFHGTIAWITAFPEASSWRRMIQAEGYFEGARARAADLGYELAEFWAAEPRLSASRLTDILLARGIQGLIIAPLPHAQGALALQWKHFAAVALGYTLARPQIHMVMNHQFRNMKRLVQRLHDEGYKRIGLAMPVANDERVDHNYLGDTGSRSMICHPPSNACLHSSPRRSTPPPSSPGFGSSVPTRSLSPHGKPMRSSAGSRTLGSGCRRTQGSRWRRFLIETRPSVASTRMSAEWAP
jgi:hypothetical protein